MRKVEVLKHFNQDDFESSSSEEEIVLLRSKWEQWPSRDAFLAHCKKYVWGEFSLEPITVASCNDFCAKKSPLVGGLKVTVPYYATQCERVCNDWNCQAVMWREKAYFYLYSWSTTA